MPQRERLKAYGNGENTPVEGFWTAEQIATY